MDLIKLPQTTHKQVSHLLNVGATFTNDVFVKLLEDWNREREAVLNLQRRTDVGVKGSDTVTGTGTGTETETGSGGSYQVGNDLLEELGTFLHLVLRPSELDDVTLLRWVREVYNDLEEDKSNYNSAKRLFYYFYCAYMVRLRSGYRKEQDIHLRELISNFFNLFSLLADDCPMKLLLHDQVFGALVLLQTGGEHQSDELKRLSALHLTEA